MPKVVALAVMRWRGAGQAPVALGGAQELGSFNFFQRGAVGEMLVFVGRTVGQKTAPGQRQTVRSPSCPPSPPVPL